MIFEFEHPIFKVDLPVNIVKQQFINPFPLR